MASEKFFTSLVALECPRDHSIWKKGFNHGRQKGISPRRCKRAESRSPNPRRAGDGYAASDPKEAPLILRNEKETQIYLAAYIAGQAQKEVHAETQ